MNTWFTADLHYGQKNVVRGESEWSDKTACRDFDTLEQHNTYLVNQINNYVKSKDILYILGDFAMGPYDNVYEFRKRLNVKKIHFVMGNHDIAIRNNKIYNTGKGYINLQSLFTSCQEIIDKKIGGVNMVLCHYPIYSYHRMQGGAIHLHGHEHKELNYNLRAACVSIDNHPEFRPYHLFEIKNIINNRLKLNENEK